MEPVVADKFKRKNGLLINFTSVLFFCGIHGGLVKRLYWVEVDKKCVPKTIKYIHTTTFVHQYPIKSKMD